MKLEQGILRPPSESKSLLLRVVRNCPWNRCRFCPAYKGERFSVRTVSEVVADIRLLASEQTNRAIRNLFLQDADALAMPVENLLDILKNIHELLPNVDRVTCYSRANTLELRESRDLARLQAAGLSRIHVGVESGCNAVLERMHKGTTFDRQKAGCLKAKAAGIALCCYVMPGLGGKELSEAHALDTGRLIREIAPNFVRLRTAMVLEGTPLAEDFRAGLFQPLTEVETVTEIERFLTEIARTKTFLASDHRINLLLDLRGSLPEEYERLMGILKSFLEMDKAEQSLFIAGRRLGLIKRMEELKWEITRLEILRQLDQVPTTPPFPVAALY